MEKSAEAFRTIAEVAETLGVAQHVLRFWEQRFPQVAPVKRAGGRRYYRPQDVALLAGLKAMLHDEGLTIRGAQKRLAEDGLAAIQARGSDWLAAQGLPVAARPTAARRAASPRPPRPTARAARLAEPPLTPQPDPAPPAPVSAAPVVAAEAAAPRQAPTETPATATESTPPEPARRPPRRAAVAGSSLPLFPDLEPVTEAAPTLAAAAPPRAPLPPLPAAEGPRYADPIAENLARLTAALRRCDGLAAGATLPDDLSRDLAALARDLRQLAADAADAAAAAG